MASVLLVANHFEQADVSSVGSQCFLFQSEFASSALLAHWSPTRAWKAEFLLSSEREVTCRDLPLTVKSSQGAFDVLYLSQFSH